MTNPNRNVRIGDEWNQAKASAARLGMTLEAWIAQAINEKLDREQAELLAKLSGGNVVDISESQA